MDLQVSNKILAEMEKYVNIIKGQNKDPSTTFRPFRPDDAILQGTEFVYDSSLASGTAGYIFAASASAKVESGMGMAQFGWYCDAYLGPDSYFITNIDGIKRNEIPASLVHKQRDPDHLLLTPLQTIFAKQNQSLEFKYYQETGETIKCIALPFGFYIGPKAQLLIE